MHQKCIKSASKMNQKWIKMHKIFAGKLVSLIVFCVENMYAKSATTQLTKRMYSLK